MLTIRLTRFFFLFREFYAWEEKLISLNSSLVKLLNIIGSKTWNLITIKGWYDCIVSHRMFPIKPLYLGFAHITLYQLSLLNNCNSPHQHSASLSTSSLSRWDSITWLFGQLFQQCTFLSKVVPVLYLKLLVWMTMLKIELNKYQIACHWWIFRTLLLFFRFL